MLALQSSFRLLGPPIGIPSLPIPARRLFLGQGADQPEAPTQNGFYGALFLSVPSIHSHDLALAKPLTFHHLHSITKYQPSSLGPPVARQSRELPEPTGTPSFTSTYPLIYIHTRSWKIDGQTDRHTALVSFSSPSYSCLPALSEIDPPPLPLHSSLFRP